MPEDAGVNGLAPHVRVREMQTRLHRWAVADPGRRFDDLYNLVCDPAFLQIAWERVAGNRGARTAGVDRAQRVQVLWDRQEISDVMLRFGRGLDLHDWDLYASTLHDPLEVDFSDLTGRPSATTAPAIWARFAAAGLEPLQVVHRYTNFLIDLDGDEASGVFYHVSRHRRPNTHGQDQYTQYGWYENRFRRTDDGWKITVLKHTFQWCDGNPTLIDTSDPAWQAVTDEIFGGGA